VEPICKQNPADGFSLKCTILVRTGGETLNGVRLAYEIVRVHVKRRQGGKIWASQEDVSLLHILQLSVSAANSMTRPTQVHQHFLRVGVIRHQLHQLLRVTRRQRNVPLVSLKRNQPCQNQAIRGTPLVSLL